MPIRAWDPLIYSSTPAASRARERLDLIDRLVDWGQFDRYLRWLDSAPTGRWPHRPITLFKSLLLEQWFSMGAAEFDFDMADRACYRRFLGLADGVAAPPHVTICAFRRLLLERDVASELEAELKRQFSDLELMMEAGSLGQLGSADGADEVLSLNIDARPQEWVALERVFLDYWRSRAGGRNADGPQRLHTQGAPGLREGCQERGRACRPSAYRAGAAREGSGGCREAGLVGVVRDRRGSRLASPSARLR